MVTLEPDRVTPGRAHPSFKVVEPPISFQACKRSSQTVTIPGLLAMLIMSSINALEILKTF